MTTEEQALWTKLQEFDLNDPDSDFAFADRLARENGWTLEYSLRAIEEYKKFIFLICVTKRPMTPSDAVDQVWHLHLIYTRSYWEEMCRDILGVDIHHGPTRGGQEEKDKYADYYAQTKDAYREVFGSIPPADIWPSSEVRFAEINFTRVNRHRNWVIPKFKFKKR